MSIPSEYCKRTKPILAAQTRSARLFVSMPGVYTIFNLSVSRHFILVLEVRVLGGGLLPHHHVPCGKRILGWQFIECFANSKSPRAILKQAKHVNQKKQNKSCAECSLHQRTYRCSSHPGSPPQRPRDRSQLDRLLLLLLVPRQPLCPAVQTLRDRYEAQEVSRLTRRPRRCVRAELAL